MALTNSAARARVQSLYGTTIVGHLHCADRLAIAKLHSDPNAHIRFQPNDESLPRFRIPVSEFPQANWLHKKMKVKWRNEVSVEPNDWPSEKKLPSAKFHPPLAAQLQINDGITRSENLVDNGTRDAIRPESSELTDQSPNVPVSKPPKKKKKKKPEGNDIAQSSNESDYGIRSDALPGRRHRNVMTDQSDLGMSYAIEPPVTAESSTTRTLNKPHKKTGNDARQGPARPRQPTVGLNRRLVENHDTDSKPFGRPERPKHSMVISSDLDSGAGFVRLASSEDDARRNKLNPPNVRSPLIPKGNYVCYKCNVPGHFFEDCPSVTPKSPKWRRRARFDDLSDSKEAVSESSVRSRRRRPLDGHVGSGSEVPARSLNFRRRAADADGSETELPTEHRKSAPQRKPRKAFYPEYLSDEEVAAGLSNGTLIEGLLQVNAKRSDIAYVRRSGNERDIKIVGHTHRNRAYDGDVVVVRILPREESSPETKEFSDPDVEDSESTAIAVDEPSGTASVPMTLDGLAAKLNAVILSDQAEADEEDQPRPVGEIVAIKTRAKDVDVDIIGYLKLLVNRDKTKSEAADEDDDATIKTSALAAPAAPVSPEPSSVILFQPVSKRIPRGFVQNSLWPSDLKSSDPDLVKMAWNSIYSASYCPWRTSQKSPRVGRLTLIGSAGHVEPETKALLRATKISHSDAFSPDVLECLKEFGYDFSTNSGQKWSIPSEVIAERRDYRNARIFTIDPSTAKDLDDALSITQITDDIFEIGVHIADVAYFIKEDSPLDLEARKRCTSVYLVQKVIPMLPPLLCEELCSLNPGVDRLSFSVVWRMDRSGRICQDTAPWFGRTVIRSCAKLDYRTAQRIVDGEPNIEIDIHGNHNFEQIANDCKQMMEIAKARRAHRFANGSLQLDRPRMHFQFDEDFNPISVGAYELHDTNRMIEEYMLLANMLVADKLCKDIPSVALLRRHMPPVLGKLNEVLEVCSKLGYKVDGQSSKTLHQTLMQIEEENVRGFISVLLTVAMKRAEYLCINGISRDPDEVPEEDGFAHYALGFETYTHFTSPIRRYADVIVHRMLEHCLARESDPSKVKKLPDPEEVSKMATRCNEMKVRAKDAQDMSLLMYLAILVKKQALVETAYVMDLGVKAFCVFVPRLGLEDRIMIEKIPGIKKAEIKKNSDSELKTLYLEWEDGHIQRHGMFEPLRVQVGISGTVPYIVQLTVLPTPPADTTNLLESN